MAFSAGSVFTPGSPVNEKDLFAGRVEQTRNILDAVSQKGYHAVLYGERGVGKTSLSNIVSGMLRNASWIVPRVNCDGTDTFTSLWRKAFKDVSITTNKTGVGFVAKGEVSQNSFDTTLPDVLTPDDIRRALSNFGPGNNILVIFDEFDRLTNKQVAVLMADTIKSLSDYSVNATILLIGVADSVDELIVGHQSVERALIQIPMPRMSREEIEEILLKGFNRIGVGVQDDAMIELISLSQGLPYIAHLLSLHSVKAALNDQRLTVETQDVESGIKAALTQWQQSIVKSYYDATQSSQPGNIYKPVLLACALAETDDLGFFSAASVRTPLRVITDRDYDIPNFAQHLKNFSDEGRGGMLQRTGETRRIRYRFTSPLMRPYIVMRGFSDGLINRRQMHKLTASIE